MKKKIKTFDDYMNDEKRVSSSDREEILFEASIIRKMAVVREKGDTVTTPIESSSVKKSTTQLKKRSIYFTNEQYLKIRIRAAQEDCDGSQIVRKAIDAYFGEDTERCITEKQ
jgi:hypothetical protein